MEAGDRDDRVSLCAAGPRSLAHVPLCRNPDQTDFDALPHGKSKIKSKVTDRLHPAGKSRAAKSKPPESASTSRWTRSGRPAPKPRTAMEEPIAKQSHGGKPTAPKQIVETAVEEIEVKKSKKKNETFSSTLR